MNQMMMMMPNAEPLKDPKLVLSRFQVVYSLLSLSTLVDGGKSSV